MHKLILAAMSGVSVLASAASAQDTQDLDLTGFDSVDAGGGFRVVVTMGDTQSVRFEGDGDDFEKINYEVRGDELRLDQQSRWFVRRHDIDVTVYVTLTEVDSLDFARGISADASGLSGRNIDVDVSTGAEVSLSGSCDALNVDLSTGAELDARELVCARVDADASTGAVGRVHATDEIEAHASMGATLQVFGNPERSDVHSSMGGNVRISRTG
jgi:opacity protein-like surface antigen